MVAARNTCRGVSRVDALLGVDVGTTNTKAVAYSLQGAPLASASIPTPFVSEGARRAHQRPEDLWQATLAAIRTVVASLPPGARLLGMAVASVGEAGVPLDAAGRPLYPIIAWYDDRSTPQCAALVAALGEVGIYRITGLPPTPIFSLNKLLWLRDHEPDVLSRMARWLCVSDYIAYRLTGEQAMGYSLASRTMAFDLQRRAWSEALLDRAGLRPNQLPPPHPEGTLVGRVAASNAAGLPEGLPVFVGGHDHVCGALAVGAFEPGVVLDSTGTTEAELVALPEVHDYLEAGDLSFSLGCHTARDRYYAIGSILGAGSTMGWVAGLLWPQEAGEGSDAALQAMTRSAAESPLGANGLYLLPHLAGAGAPQRNPTSRGLLAGLHLGHTRGDIARATFEGMAIELRLLLEALEGYAGHAIERLAAVGGGARNAVWTQIKADVLGRAVSVPEHPEAATLGAAILAGIGAGAFRDEREAYAELAPPSRAVAPDSERHRAYNALYRRVMAEVRPLAAELGRRSGATPNAG